METTPSPQLEQGYQDLKKVVQFIWISIGIAIVSSLVALGFLINSVMNIISMDPEAKSGALVVAVIIAVLGMALSIGVSIFLAKFIAKGRNWARWVYLVMTVFGLYTGLSKVSFSNQTLLITIITIGLYVVGLALQGYICYMLFGSQARLVFLKDKMARLEKDLQALRKLEP